MDVQMMPLGKLKPYPNNPRVNKDAIVKVAASIKEFGFKQPIVVDKDYVVVVGHTRLSAAKKLKLKEVPVLVANDLTEEQAKAYRLADNKTNEFSLWDSEKLKEELEEILEIDMTDFGFEFDFDAPEDPGQDIEEDDIDEDVESMCHTGDVWILGRHRLICGDSTQKETLERLMNGKKANLMLTDPPYGIDVVQNNVLGTTNKAKTGVYKPIIGDDTTDSAKAVYGLSKSFSKNQIIFGGNYFTEFLPPTKSWIVWDKNTTGNYAEGELAWTSFDKKLKIYEFTWNGMIRGGDKKIEGEKRVHPTQKPVGLLADILKDYTKDGDRVLDCFGGSGSTLIACEHTNRECYICEMNEHYCDVIINRFYNLTGIKPEKEE